MQAGRFPSRVVVTTHRGDQVSFFEDLIDDRVVLLHFLSGDDDALLARADEVRAELGPQLGRDIFLLSVTAVPWDPARLDEIARRLRPGAGWTLVTGPEDSLAPIRRALFVQEPDPDDRRPSDAAGTDWFRYGRGGDAGWGTCSVQTSARGIARRLRWVLGGGAQSTTGPASFGF